MNSSTVNPEFEALLQYLKRNRGCDLTDYKRSTLMRRFQHRMQQIKVDNYHSYLLYLKSHSEEYLNLLNEVLINVTCFFRDREAWDYLTAEIIPKILASKEPDEPIRVWSAGCAAGQEIYTLLILLAEALGIESCLKRVQCYATDVDEDALAKARQGNYSDLEITEIPANFLDKYFEKIEDRYLFHPQLRRIIIFGHHDLTRDPPISKIDLLLCRNVFIYFNLEAQSSILVRFHFALKNSGFLFLGKSETLVYPRPIFTPLNLKQRVYSKGLPLDIQEHLSIKTLSSKNQELSTVAKNQQAFLQSAFATNLLAQLAVDLNDRLIAANNQATLLFELTPDDWNRPFTELEPGKLISPQISMATFYHHRCPVILKNIYWVKAKITRCFDIEVSPVFNSQKHLLGISLTFLDVTLCIHLAKKLNYTESELEMLSELFRESEMN